MYVDLTKDHSRIGAFANWFAVADNVDGFVHFSSLIDILRKATCRWKNMFVLYRKRIF